ncbi:MAG TPA: hypothetical protein VFY36_07520 [Solirubrobacteraceae bacterium]|nr:hypothetical protein [Solirubrobacteraceae bacterium]
MIGLSVVLALAVGGLVTTTALAVPEFLHEGKEVVKKGFTVKSGAATIFVEIGETKYKIACTSSSATGKIKGTKEVEAVVIKFKGCKAKENEEALQCEVKSTSPLGAKEEIVTKTLKGRLGTVAVAEAASERGLALEAAVGTAFTTIKGSTECLPAETSEVKGTLIGEIKPVKVPKLKGELIYKAKEEKTQWIKKLGGEMGIHELEVFEVKTPLQSTATTEFEEMVEVT